MPEQPEQFAAGMAKLLEMARELLKPSPDQEILIMAVSKEDISDIQGRYEEPLQAEPVSNVVPLFGGPVAAEQIEDELRAAERAQTAEMLMDLAARAENGELRGAIVVVGLEVNAGDISEVETAVAECVTDNLAVFLGGMELAKQHAMDVYSEECAIAAGEFE